VADLVTFQVIEACRSCAGTELLPVLDLGEQPLANSFHAPDDPCPEVRYPLALVCCTGCSLVQLTGTVPPTRMFDDYHYFSSYSTTMVAEMAVLAKRVVHDLELSPTDLVVEVASNDGYLLKHYQHLGVPVLGIEPAANVAAVAVAAGVPTVVEYFGTVTARRVLATHGHATVLHANNVMAHVPEINDFVAGFAVLLAEHGVAYVESPYLGRFIADCSFDTTYHEHVFYYSLTALDRLVRRHGLVVSDVEQLAIHGGTLRCALRREGAPVSRAVTELLASEASDGIATAEYYRGFSDRVEALKAATLKLVVDLKADGATIAAYGAAAKGTVLLNHFGIGADLIDVVVDRNPHKQGLVMPGVGIPIADPAVLLQRMPTHVLLLVWNFADEVLEQQRAYRAAGGLFLIPIPEPRFV
jgi:hypothetical protein